MSYINFFKLNIILLKGKNMLVIGCWFEKQKNIKDTGRPKKTGVYYKCLHFCFTNYVHKIYMSMHIHFTYYNR